MTQPKVVFAPGCFDDFNGTQEELDEIMAELQRLAESGELLADSEILGLERLSESERDLLARVEQMENLDPTRTLH